MDKEEEGLAGGSRKEAVTDGEEVGKGGAAREKGVLGGVEERGDKRNEKGGEVPPNNPICGGGDSYRPELVRGGNREGLGDQGDVRGREGGGEAIRGGSRGDEGGEPREKGGEVGFE